MISFKQVNMNDNDDGLCVKDDLLNVESSRNGVLKAWHIVSGIIS